MIKFEKITGRRVYLLSNDYIQGIDTIQMRILAGMQGVEPMPDIAKESQKATQL